ncbi:MAG TPA: hypothetical protein VMZ28_01175 [Kofleriaceae bacterium]|nr:hypothetical protein [Kofleriaceae bacterium]
MKWAAAAAAVAVAVGIPGAARGEGAATLPAGVWKADVRYLAVAGGPVRVRRSLVVPAELLGSLGLAPTGGAPAEAEAEDLELGELDLEVEFGAQVLAPGLSYGVTDWLSVGFVLPVFLDGAVVVRRFEYEGAWGYNPEFRGDRSRSLLLPAFDARAGGGAAGLQRALVEGFEYEPIDDVHARGLGDLIVAARARLWQTRHTVAALQPELLVPTGATDDPDNLIDFGLGDGHLDLGATFLLDVALTRSTILGLEAGATHTFPHMTTARVYQDPAFPIAARAPWPEPYAFIGYQRPVQRDPGEIVELGAAITQTLHPAWSLTGRYGLLASASDHFSDATSRLPALEQDTSRLVHTAGAALRFTLVDSFLRGHAPLPLELSLDLARTFSTTPQANMTMVTATATLFLGG